MRECCRRQNRCRWPGCLPVLPGRYVQNGLQKRIETPEWYFSVPPVFGGVAEYVKELLAHFLVKARGGRDVFKHDDKAGLRAALVQRVSQAVVERIKVFAEVRRESELPRNAFQRLLFALRVREVSVEKMVAELHGGVLQVTRMKCAYGLHDVGAHVFQWQLLWLAKCLLHLQQLSPFQSNNVRRGVRAAFFVSPRLTALFF